MKIKAQKIRLMNEAAVLHTKVSLNFLQTATGRGQLAVFSAATLPGKVQDFIAAGIPLLTAAAKNQLVLNELITLAATCMATKTKSKKKKKHR